MTPNARVAVTAACLPLVLAGCAARPHTQRSHAAMQTAPNTPSATTFTPAPLRHRLRLELNAAVPAVWALVGHHARLPEYSAGIASVDVEEAPGGARAYVCHFRSPDGSGPGPSLRSLVRWEAEGVGYATVAEPGNAFGLSDALELVTLEPSPAGTLVSWQEFYDSADLPAARASYDDGLADMAARLVARFGGRVVERFVDEPR